MNRRIQFIAAAFALAWVLPGFVYAQHQKTASLQYHLQDGRLSLSAKVFEIDDTLVLGGDRTSGGTIQGSGIVDTTDGKLKVYEGRGTVLRAVGDWPPGKPMIRVRCRDFSLNGFTLDGNGKASIGVHIDKTGVTGIAGPGKSYDCSFRVENATESAIQIASQGDDLHCDNLKFETLSIQNCPVGVYCKGNQAMGHYFNFVHAVNVERIFVYESGGCLVCHDLKSIKCGTVLTLRENPVSKYTTAHNNGDFVLGYIKADSQAASSFRLLDMEVPRKQWFGLRVVSRGGRISGDPPKVFANVERGASLHIEDWSNVPRESIENNHGRLTAERIYATGTGGEWSE